MEKHQIYILHLREKEGTLDDAGKAELNKLLEDSENVKIYKDLDKIWLASNEIPGPNTNESWDRLKASIDVSAKANKATWYNSRKTWYYVAAASIVIGLLTFLFPILQSNTVSYQTASGELLHVKLPDGTYVTLSQNSNITYQEVGSNRNLKFDGEAYFEIAKDESRPFTIEGAHSMVKILGTKFYLLDQKTMPTVLLEVNEGKVKFGANKEAFKILVGGEKALLNDGKLTISNLPKKFDETSFGNGEMEFNEASLEEVILRLEVRYGIQIIANNPALLQCTFSGSFKEESSEEALQIVCRTLGFTSEQINNIYHLKGNICE